MADLIDFIPLFGEDESEIRARLDAAVNAGVAPTDPDFVDTREGSIFYDLTQAILLEAARIWDALSTEVPAAAFVTYAWGEYLDEHATVVGLERKAAVRASGEVTFTGTAGIPVPAGVTVSPPRTDPDVTPPEFTTTASGVISGVLATPTGLVASASGGGFMAPGTYYYVVTAINDYGETLKSSEVSVVVSPNGKVLLDWSDVIGATGYRVYRSTTTALETLLKEVPASTFTDTGVDPEGEEAPPLANDTGGRLRVPVQATEVGTLGNVGANAITIILTPVGGVESVTNEEVMKGGAEEESDEDLRERVLIEYQGAGPGTVTDYKRWALAYPGVGRVKVVPVRDGPGTVAVIIADREGGPLSDLTVDGLQDQLDPLPGQGAGLAPIGASVSVETPATVSVDVVATVELLTGYSLDGTDNSVAVRSTILAALEAYVNRLLPGEEVVYNHVESEFFEVRGVHDVSALTINGSVADIAITENPPRVARLGTVTLTQLP